MIIKLNVDDYENINMIRKQDVNIFVLMIRRLNKFHVREELDLRSCWLRIHHTN